MTTRIDEILASGIREILQDGTHKTDRTTVGGNIYKFGQSFHYDLSNVNPNQYYVGFMQHRTFAPRIAFEELMWMLRGQTDVQILQDKNIHIWDGNSSIEYLAKVGKSHITPNTIGKGYGYQMRNFNGVDQLVNVYNQLKTNPNKRTSRISLWNPADFDDTALEPCHHGYTFSTNGNNVLNLHQEMRSNDVMFGRPYNIAFASLWLTFFAIALDMEVGEVFFTGTDCHIYDNQIEVAKDTLKVYDSRPKEYTRPYITINKELNSLEDILELEWSDIEVHNWKKGEKIGNAKMAV